MSTWKAIVAIASNDVIGAGNAIPWHLPEDLKWFKSCTTGHTVVMGRRTWESLTVKPLPRRRNVVVSRNLPELTGALVVKDLDAVERLEPQGEIWVIGGAELYRTALPRCSDLFVTHVKREAEGDVLFPPWRHLFAVGEVVRDTPEFTITHYTRLP